MEAVNKHKLAGTLQTFFSAAHFTGIFKSWMYFERGIPFFGAIELSIILSFFAIENILLQIRKRCYLRYSERAMFH